VDAYEYPAQLVCDSRSLSSAGMSSDDQDSRYELIYRYNRLQ